MPLSQLEFWNIRAYEHARIEPDPRLNLIRGANASGKTSLLEAIHLLSSGRSFRASQSGQVCRYGQKEFQITGRCIAPRSEVPHTLGYSAGPAGRVIKVNGEARSKLADMAQHLPLLVISPDSHFEFQQNARYRRAILDWLLFHVEPDFPDLWQRYQRVLQQRNASLKDSRQAASRAVWGEGLERLGSTIQEHRRKRLGGISTQFRNLARELLGVEYSADLWLECGWREEIGLAACLRADQFRDAARGFTHSGPHRGDLKILLDDVPSRDSASHGQNKLLLVALRLAQIQQLNEITGKRCCLLIDDLSAELDGEHHAKIVEILSHTPAQVFVTSTASDRIEWSGWDAAGRFHVEHGHISRE